MKSVLKSGTSMGSMSREEYNRLQENSIKEWHFERCENGKRGVKPIEGKYDPTNPKHIKPSDIIKINQRLKG